MEKGASKMTRALKSRKHSEHWGNLVLTSSKGFRFENSPFNSPVSAISVGSPRQSRGVQSLRQERQHTPRKAEVNGTVKRLVDLFVDWDSAYEAADRHTQEALQRGAPLWAFNLCVPSGR
jgi:hypothetical protein